MSASLASALLCAFAVLRLGTNPHVADGCTTIAVGRHATSDGSVLSSHSNDGEGTTDPRLVLIPASTWPSRGGGPNNATTTRKVFYSPESFPRYVGYDRASVPVPAYEPGRGDNPSRAFEPICEIPQVERTYRYFEETYGAMNERQLGISESTCSGVFGAAPKGMHFPGYGVGKACLSVDALSQIAMERHHTARDAILEMGALAVQYGFYGAGLFEGTAESLIVTDTKEAWVFHILPDPTGSSAIWAARRVPDDSFAVVPNVFIIRNIDVDDADNVLYSDSVFTVAEKLGWWSKGSGRPLDFTATYSDGEYSHKYYSGRRSWGVFTKFAPSLDLEPNYEEWRISDPYPFAAKPDSKVGVEDVAEVMRSYYEGTAYSQGGDTSAGLNLAGGPWKSPDHVAGGSGSSASSGGAAAVEGNWERTIGLYRTSDSYMTQSRSYLPDAAGGVLWYGAYAAPYAVYTPFAAGMTSLPDATLGHHLRLDKGTLFWANRFVGNYVQLKWTHMMAEVVAFQKRRMEENLRLQGEVDDLVSDALDDIVSGALDDEGVHNPDDSSSAAAAAIVVVDAALDLYTSNAVETVAKTWELADHLLFKYADGQVHRTHYPSSSLGTSTPPRKYDAKGATTIDADVVDQPGYPDAWLEAVGYGDGPPPPPECRELGWRCGHKPRRRPRAVGKGGDGEGSEGGLLRSGDGAAAVVGDDAVESNEMIATSDGGAEGVVEAWEGYAARKKEAAGAACAATGDVAAAIGGGGGRGAKCVERERAAADEAMTSSTA